MRIIKGVAGTSREGGGGGGSKGGPLPIFSDFCPIADFNSDFGIVFPMMHLTPGCHSVNFILF